MMTALVITKKRFPKTPSSNNAKIGVQLEPDDGMYGDDEKLHTNANVDHPIWTCPQCNETMDLYWKKHHGCEVV